MPLKFEFHSIMKLSTLLSLDRQYSFYRHYHSNTANRRIHYVCVPILMVTGLAILSSFQFSYSTLNLAYPVVAFYAVYGFLLNVQLGITFLPVIFLCYMGSVALTNAFGPANVKAPALVIHIFGWVVQFAGHFIFEKKSPALYQSFVQAVTASPVVLWMDIVFSFGYMPDLKARINRAHIVAKARKAVNQSSE